VSVRHRRGAASALRGNSGDGPALVGAAVGGTLGGMNTESPEGQPQGDEHGVWSEDMELAPVHPGDREPEPTGDRQGERLQKVLARAGIGSRRVCEDMIAEGRISVNGKLVREQGMRVDPQTDQITVDGQRIDVRNDRVTYAMNKPSGVLTAMSDDRNRPTVGDMVGDLAAGLVHVGRLDQDTEGLLLLTTDGELAHRLAHPSFEVRKTYLAQVSGSVPRDLGKRLHAGIELEDGPVAVDGFQLMDTHAGQSVVEIVLHEGRKRIVRRLLAEVGLPVSRLTRTAVGPIELARMRTGSIRRLTVQEVGALHELVGL
jgi:23S rRNA pseudouridine2605 synthase